MRRHLIYRSVRPYVSASALLITVTLLIAAIYYNELGLPWISFLAGVLAAAIMAGASRTSRAQWIITRREAKLASAQEKQNNEMRMHHEVMRRLGTSKIQLHLLEQLLPVMAIYVDAEGLIGFHNHSFRDWLGLRAAHIDGCSLREVLGAKTFGEVSVAVGKALAGQTVAFKHSFTGRDRMVREFHVDYLPYLDSDGKSSGFFVLQTAVAAGGEAVLRPARSIEAVSAQPLAGKTSAEQDMFIESFSEEITGGNDAVARIRAAIEQDEFRLYCQRIVPLAPAGPHADYHEVFIRLIEEEEGMMPPGAFFPLVEKCNLMPHLDRWVVNHIVDWAASRPAKSPESLFFINLALATMSDAEFPGYVHDQLGAYGVAPRLLCFEITDSELMQRHDDAIVFVKRIREYGCSVAISGFGHERVSFESLRELKVDFLKIDGSIILHLLHKPTELAKVTAIARVAKTIGVRTVAEFVESDACIVKLRGLGVDFVQGFGVSPPRPLSDLA